MPLQRSAKVRSSAQTRSHTFELPMPALADKCAAARLQVTRAANA